MPPLMNKERLMQPGSNGPRHYGTILLFIVLALSSCSSPAPSAETKTASEPTPPVASSGDGDVCALVTAEEMSQIFGETVTSQPKTLQTGIPACTYKAASRNPIPGATITLHKPGKAIYSSAQAMFKKTPGYQEVSGIGEQAMDSGDGAFYALKGDTCLDIVLTQKPELRLEQFKKIATLAVGKM
jgi:hypothetical protein